MDEEESQKDYEDDFFINQTIISLVKENSIIFEDLGYDEAFLKNIDPLRDQKLEKAFNSIASRINNLDGSFSILFYR